MNLNQLLHDHASEILSDADAAIARARLTHYEKSGAEHTHQRLKALYTLTARAVQEKNLGPMVAHAETIGRERFETGFDLSEVQTAFNVLEEAIWKRILKALSADEMAEALGLISMCSERERMRSRGRMYRWRAKQKLRRSTFNRSSQELRVDDECIGVPRLSPSLADNRYATGKIPESKDLLYFVHC